MSLQETREERRLIRQRGAGARELKTASFGFSFGVAAPPVAQPVILTGPQPRAVSTLVEQPDDSPKADSRKQEKTRTRSAPRTLASPKCIRSAASPNTRLPKKRGRPRKIDVQKISPQPEVPVIETEERIVTIKPRRSVASKEKRAPTECAQEVREVESKPVPKKRRKAAVEEDVPSASRYGPLAQGVEPLLTIGYVAPQGLKAPRARIKRATTANETTAAPEALVDCPGAESNEAEQMVPRKRVVSGRPRKRALLEVSNTDIPSEAVPRGQAEATEIRDPFTEEIGILDPRRAGVIRSKLPSDKPNSSRPKKVKSVIRQKLEKEQEAEDDVAACTGISAEKRETFDARPVSTTCLPPKQGKGRKHKTQRRESEHVRDGDSPSLAELAPKHAQPRRSSSKAEEARRLGKDQAHQQPESKQFVTSVQASIKPPGNDRLRAQHAKTTEARPALLERTSNPQLHSRHNLRVTDDDPNGLGAILKRYGNPKIPSTLAMASDPRLRFRF